MVWVLCALWSAAVLYVLVDVRRIMAFNDRVNKRVLGVGDPPVTDRSVLINRAFLVAVLPLGNWAIWHFASLLEMGRAS